MSRSHLIPLALVLASCFSGCGDGKKSLPNLVPVSGNVTFDGKPLEQGTIGFAPVDPTGQSASGAIKNGYFQLDTNASSPGAVIGKYKVRVESKAGGQPGVAASAAGSGRPPVPPKSVIPVKYSDIQKSGLEADITKGTSALKFDLKSE